MASNRVPVVHFQAAFELRPRLGVEREAEAIFQRIRGWAESKVGLVFGPLDWLRKGGRRTSAGGEVSLMSRADGAGSGACPARWALRLTRKSQDELRLWIEDVAFEAMKGGVLAFRVTVSMRETELGQVRDPFSGRWPFDWVSAPGIIGDLLQNSEWRPTAGSVALSPGPVWLARNGADTLSALLENPGRRCPVIVISRRMAADGRGISPEDIAGAVAGAAIVVSPVDDEAEEEVRKGLPPHLFVPAGGECTFWPQHELDDDDEPVAPTRTSLANTVHDGWKHTYNRIVDAVVTPRRFCPLGQTQSVEDLAPGEKAEPEEEFAEDDVPALLRHLKTSLEGRLKALEDRLGALEARLPGGEAVPPAAPPEGPAPHWVAHHEMTIENAPEIHTAFGSWDTGDLVNLLRSAGDRLPAQAVTEMMLRHGDVLPLLRDILADEDSWCGAEPWAAVHAFLLYLDFTRPVEFSPETGGLEAEARLRAALPDVGPRWAVLEDAVDRACRRGLDRTLLADMPAVLAAQGSWVWDRIADHARNTAHSPAERRVYVAALAAVALAEGTDPAADPVLVLPGRPAGIGTKRHLDALRAIAADASKSNDSGVRFLAARRLLDFVRPADRDFLLLAAASDPSRCPELLVEEVEEAYTRGVPDLSAYGRDFQRIHHDALVCPEEGIEPAELTLPLPGWRQAEIDRLLRHFATEFTGPLAGPGLIGGRPPVSPALEPTARAILEVLVRRRLCVPRFWRQPDIAAFVAAVLDEDALLAEQAQPDFVESAATFLEILARREQMESRTAADLAAWLRRRSKKIATLLRARSRKK